MLGVQDKINKIHIWCERNKEDENGNEGEKYIDQLFQTSKQIK
jgi:hypothetical protein